MNANIIARETVEGRKYGPGELFNCWTNWEAPNWSDFTHLEVGGCITEPDETEESGGYTVGGIERHAAEFFTVYGRTPHSGVEAITDAADFETVMAIAEHLSGLSGLEVGVYC